MSFLNLNRQAEGYLNPPADRPRWPDTWTLRRTRGEALGRLLTAYAGWPRTVAGVVSPVLVIGGAYLLGLGMDGAEEGWISILLTVLGALLTLAGLLACGAVLVTGLTVVGAISAWAAIRAQDGGPGVRAVGTAAGVVRAVAAVLALAGGTWLVLGLLDVVEPVLESPGGRFTSWAAAVICVLAGVVALIGLVLVTTAVRRSPAGQGAAAAPVRSDTADGAAQPGTGAGPAHDVPAVPGRPGAPGAPAVPEVPEVPAPWAAAAGPSSHGRSAYGGTGYAAPAYGAPAGEPPPHPGDGYPAPPAQSPGDYGMVPSEPAPEQGAWAPPPMTAADPAPVAPSFAEGPGFPADPARQTPGAPDAVGPTPGAAGGMNHGEPSELERTTLRPGAAPGAQDDLDDTRLVADKSTPARVRFQMDDGRVMGSEGVSLLGRSPAARAGETVAALVTLTDSAVSKTHLALRIEGARAWVTDRASTNGTLLVTASGAERRLVPWEETPVAPGEVLQVGTSVLRVELDRAPGATTLSRDDQ